MDLTGDLSGTPDDLVIAMRVTNLQSDADAGGVYDADTWLVSSGDGTNDETFIRIRGTNDDAANWRVEKGNEANAFSGNDGTDWALGETKSVFLRVTAGSQEMIIDGVSIDTETAGTSSGFIVPSEINSVDGLGGEAGDIVVTGFAVFTASGAGDASTGLDYDDFFDGSDLPIDAAFSGDAVAGFSPVVALNTVASWNDYSGTTGTVLDGSAMTIASQSITRGALTLEDAAAHTFSASSGTITSIGSLGGSDAADWDVSLDAGVVSISPAGDGVANGPYTLVLPLLR